jgi:hypothetical protein
MNANELADEVEMWGRDLLALNMKGGVPVIEGARLIRQQQAEIDSLRKNLDVALMMVDDLEKGLESSIYLNKAQALRKAQE